MHEVYPHLKGCDLHWVAAILEAEGSFTRRHLKRTNYHYPVVQIAMTDRDVMQRLQRLLGVSGLNGPYTFKHSKKPSWQLCIGGQNGYNLMKLLLPLMSYRRARKMEMLLSVHEEERARAKSNPDRHNNQYVKEQYDARMLSI